MEITVVASGLSTQTSAGPELSNLAVGNKLESIKSSKSPDEPQSLREKLRWPIHVSTSKDNVGVAVT